MPNQEKQIHNYQKSITRYRILAGFLFVLILAVGWWGKQGDGQANRGSPYSFIDPAREFIKQEDYILNIQSLRDYLHSLEQKYPERVSVYYEQLNSGANISVNKELRLFPASLSKLPFGILAVKRVESGVWNWDTQLTIEEGDIDGNSGDLYKTVKVGESYSVEFLLEHQLTESDNTAHHVFVRNIGLDDLAEYQKEVGLEDLFNQEGYVSAKEYSRILRSLYTSSFLGRENSQKILKLMTETSFHDYLAQGIPQGVPFANKYGENRAEKIFANAGIVYQGNRPYLLTVILKGEDTTSLSRDWAVSLMKEISEKAYQAGL